MATVFPKRAEPPRMATPQSGISKFTLYGFARRLSTPLEHMCYTTTQWYLCGSGRAWAARQRPVRLVTGHPNSVLDPGSPAERLGRSHRLLENCYLKHTRNKGFGASQAPEIRRSCPFVSPAGTSLPERGPFSVARIRRDDGLQHPKPIAPGWKGQLESQSVHFHVGDDAT
jgi:hypothetical protein